MKYSNKFFLYLRLIIVEIVRIAFYFSCLDSITSDRHFQNLFALINVRNYLNFGRTFQIIPKAPILLINTLRAIAPYNDDT